MIRWEMNGRSGDRLAVQEPFETETGALSRSLVLSTTGAAEMKEFYESLVFSRVSGGSNRKDATAACFRGPLLTDANSRWLIRIVVEDLPAALQRAELLGGRLVMLDDPDTFVVQAPDGSEIILSNIPGHTQAAQEVLELCTSDLAGSSAFYCSLLGLATVSVPDDPHSYVVFTDDGGPVAGAVDMGTFLATAAPAHWIPYFHVDELYSTIAMAVDYGALVKVPLTMSNFSVRYAVLTDPAGATFGLREMPAGGVYGSWHRYEDSAS